MKILISPYSRLLKDGKRNPKNYPWWNEVIKDLPANLPVYDNIEVSQLVYGTEPRLLYVHKFIQYATLADAEAAIKKCDMWISVDNWVQHYAHFIGKRGIVIWGKSDPHLFGYHENMNLLKGREFLRPRQFEWWELDTFDESVFIEPKIVLDAVRKFAF